MKFRPRWPLACLLLIFLLLLFRLLWTLGFSADSWRLLADEWRQQILSLTSWEIPVPYQTPAEQATYWVAQTREIDTAQQDPQVALGAAWMLDSPCELYKDRHYYSARFDKRSLTYLLLIDQEWERETLEAMGDDFEPVAREACLNQSKLAIRLAPENKDVWRNRAMLLFELRYNANTPPYYRFIPRQENWQKILDECARHDPENALYDYLAAIYFWSVSSQQTGEQKFEILDSSKYQHAKKRLQAGLKKTFLETAYTGNAETFAFLSHTSFLLDQQLDLVQSRQGEARDQQFLVKLLRFLEQEFLSEERQKNYESAALVARNLLHISQQLSEKNTYYYFADMKQVFELNGLVKILNLHKADPGLLTPAEYKKLSHDHSQSLLKMYEYEEVLNRKTQESYPIDSTRFFQSALLSATSLNLVFITLASALLFGGLSWFGKRDPNPEFVSMGFWRPLICCLSGIGISLLFWGLYPAQIIPLQLQYLSLRWLYWIGYFLIILGFLYLIHAGFSIPWPELFALCCLMSILVLFVSQFTNLYHLWFQTPVATIVAIAAVLLLFGVLSLRYSRNFFGKKLHSTTVSLLICGLVLLLVAIVMPYGLNLARVYQIPANLIDPLYPVTWRNILGMYAIVGIPEYNYGLYDSTASQIWLVWYWLAGEVFAAVISLSLFCSWYLNRQARFVEGGFSELLQNRKSITLCHAGRTLAKTCLWAALPFSLVYLVVTPAVLKPNEEKTLKHYRKMADSDFARQEIEALRAEIVAEPDTMTRIRNQADKNQQRFLEQPFPPEQSGEVY
ncbi:hypothetical protein [Gimesia sp.]|uniref:hypothetical protein n=1 Tax=Gimesia sp. TaxID=2024833 RepID=UPI0032EE0597